MTSPEPLAHLIAQFAVDLQWKDIPEEVQEKATLLFLDAVGVAVAATPSEFADRAWNAIGTMSEPSEHGVSVIGRQQKLPLRDAVMMNGLLVHGLDFDDTHPGSVVHASASTAVTALAMAEQVGASGQELLTAYVVGLEVATQLGLPARGAFHRHGLHPTGLLGAYASAVVAARLRGLTVDQLAGAQGVVHSFASGSLEFLQDGAWTKRLHPGWAAVAGVTAAAFASVDYVAPSRPYEGRFGLFATHARLDDPDLETIASNLGVVWETSAVAVKPYPACHFTHAFVDAAIALRTANALDSRDIARVRCLIAEDEVPAVCDPLDAKRRPTTTYEAQFSLPYVTATALVRGAFTLDHLEPDQLISPDVLALADRVTYELDSDSAFPSAFSGEIIIELHDGRELRHREQVNRGAADRPLSPADVMAKFGTTAGTVLGTEEVDRLRDAVLDLHRSPDVASLTARLRTAAP
ncbi:MmgE/PrpD family protein [Aeromicrobium sp. CF4.19]|uniref:MmgE/PrpD family protein n=1 Tax=Aeromicrobium sp. CF4.19 TaxID=3373082 RepID=UPI003EE6BA98